MGSNRTHAPIWVPSVTIPSCSTRPARSVLSCRRARPPRSVPSSSLATTSASPSAPFASTCSGAGRSAPALAGQPRAFGRFQADRPNELWIGDVLVGPFVPYPRAQGSKRAYLFVLVDDAINRLHKASQALPRALNNVAIAALIAAATAGKALVDDECAKRAAVELTRD